MYSAFIIRNKHRCTFSIELHTEGNKILKKLRIQCYDFYQFQQQSYDNWISKSIRLDFQVVVDWWFFSWKSNLSPEKQYQSTRDNFIICRKQNTIIPRILILEAKETGSGCLIQEQVFSDAIGHILDLFPERILRQHHFVFESIVISIICYMQIPFVWA